jgi:hypothetical protein
MVTSSRASMRLFILGATPSTIIGDCGGSRASATPRDRMRGVPRAASPGPALSIGIVPYFFEHLATNGPRPASCIGALRPTERG